MLQDDARESIACDHYIDALDDADFGLKVRERAPASLDDALRISLQLEAWMNDASRTRRDNSTKPKTRGANMSDGDDKQLNDRLNRLEDDMTRCLNELMRLNQTSVHGAVVSEPQPIEGDAKLRSLVNETGTHRGYRCSKLVCWGCGQAGHVSH